MKKTSTNHLCKILVGTFVGLASLFLSSAPLHAATTGGITLTPPFQEVLILPHQTSVPGSFSVANNNAQPATFNLSAIDMGALDDTGGVVFSGLSADYQQKYGLAHWLKLDKESVTVAPKSSQTIGFSIQNDDTLGPGGHYGAIIIKSTNQAGGSNNQVNLNPQAASLLFVRKVGGEIYKLNVDTPKTKTYLWGLPDTLTLKFHNAGNIHVVPRGIVTIKDPFGHVVSKGVINEASSLILPEHARDYTPILRAYKKILWPGKYKVSVQYRYEGTNTFQNTDFTIVVVSIPVLILGLFVTAGLLATLWFLARWLWPKIRRKIPFLNKPKSIKPAPTDKIVSVRRFDDVRRVVKKDKK